MDSLGVYIQVPFCASKCSFCNFSSKVVRSPAFEPYCLALSEEAERLPLLYEAIGIPDGVLALPVDTIYVGGGTPSILGAGGLARIVASIRRRFLLADSCEFSLEVTPGSADADYLADGLALGVNRLSIGAQTFEDHELRAVGRLHSAEATGDLMSLARRAGFDNISLDLVAGLPHQTEASWRHSLERVVSLRPQHVSIYLFEIDDKSRLGKEVVQGGTRYHAEAVPDDEFMADAYDQAATSLTRAGYVQYEISNFAIPGCESRHNRKYWRLDPYVGLGAGAHSFDGEYRWANEHDLGTYQAKLARGESPVAELRHLKREKQVEEFFFLGLRQTEGVSLLAAEGRWGKSLVREWFAIIDALVGRGLVERADGRIRLTREAYLISNEVFLEFIHT